MKTIAKYLALVVVASSSMFTSCVSKKKMAASAAHIEKLKQDSIATHRKLDAKMALAEKRKAEEVTVEKKQEAHAVKPKTRTPKTTVDPEHFSPLPPSKVDSVFRLAYPYASEIVWTNEKLHRHSEASIEHAYKASFLLQQKRHIVVYAENGKVVETRAEILPDQLPENVYEAIKKKYPEEQIVSAATYKSTRTKGSYTAIVKSKLHGTERMLIVAENGTIVE